MKILGLDTSGMTASAALVEDEILTGEYSVNYKKTHSQTLLPMLDELVKMTETDLHSLDGIAVAAGPGSFTGLRIGSATAKGLGLSLDKPLISVPTLDALAFNLYDVPGLVCPMMDARRNQVYTGLYRYENHRLVSVRESEALSVEDLLQILEGYGEEVHFTGDGVPVYREKILEGAAFPFSFAPAHLNRQRAAAVAALGLEYFKQGKIQTAAEHAPIYLRVSQAERERAERLKRNGEKP